MYLKDDSSISNINNRCAIAVSHVFFLYKTHLLIALKGIDSSIYIVCFYLFFLRSQWQSPFT